VRAQRRGCDAVGPLPCATDAPVWILGLVRQPTVKVPALIGPIGMAEQHAAAARFDGKAAAKSEAGDSPGAADARRILRQRILIGADLQPQSSSLAVDADIGSRGADQRNAMDECRRRVAGRPRAAQGMPLQHHALAAEINYGDCGGVVHGHAFKHIAWSFCRRVGKRALHHAGGKDLRQNHRFGSGLRVVDHVQRYAGASECR
jgi:hypothetical protein